MTTRTAQEIDSEFGDLTLELGHNVYVLAKVMVRNETIKEHLAKLEIERSEVETSGSEAAEGEQPRS